MYVKKADKIKKEPVVIADRTEIQWLIGKDVGKNFYMRKFTMKPGGSMPKHYHNNYEHEQYVLKGKLKLYMGDEVVEVETGDVVYIPENVPHWYKNEEIGRLVDRARKTLDYEDRLEIYQELQELISDKALALYAYEIPALFTSQDYLIGPKETFPIVGPTVNMYNWRINLAKKMK